MLRCTLCSVCLSSILSQFCQKLLASVSIITLSAWRKQSILRIFPFWSGLERTHIAGFFPVMERTKSSLHSWAMSFLSFPRSREAHFCFTSGFSAYKMEKKAIKWRRIWPFWAGKMVRIWCQTALSIASVSKISLHTMSSSLHRRSSSNDILFSCFLKYFLLAACKLNQV